MKQKEMITSSLFVNIFSLVLMFFSTLIFLGIHIKIYNIKIRNINFILNIFDSFIFNIITFLGFITIALIVHELIHGFSFAYFSKNGFSSIKFGVNWKYLAFYTHCSEKVTAFAYRISLVLPLFILGIIPAILGISINSLFFTYFGIIFISVAGADLWILILIRNVKSNTLIKDHPEKAGCIIYFKE